MKRRQTSEYDVSKVDHRCLSIDKNETQFTPVDVDVGGTVSRGFLLTFTDVELSIE